MWEIMTIPIVVLALISTLNLGVNMFILLVVCMLGTNNREIDERVRQRIASPEANRYIKNMATHYVRNAVDTPHPMDDDAYG